MTDMTLNARAAVFNAAIASIEVTDRSGRPLDPEAALLQMLHVLLDLRQRTGSLYIVGNGGSAAVASHSVVDFLKLGGVRAFSLTDPPLLTAMANDHSYADSFARMLSVVAQPRDVLIAISSSGRSPNVVNAVAGMRERAAGGTVVTLSGFAPDNPLRTRGDLNVWIQSQDYGMVEAAHQFVLHNLIDRLASGSDAAKSEFR